MSDDGNVVCLNGGCPVVAREPSEALIEVLEDLLVAARAGEIVGMCGGFMHSDGVGSYRVTGRVGSYSLLGAVSMAERDLKDWMVEYG